VAQFVQFMFGEHISWEGGTLSRKAELKMKSYVNKLTAGALLFAMASVTQAAVINSESVITNPATTEGLWAYSYLENNPAITSHMFYYTTTSQYAGAQDLGYLTGESGPWSPQTDSFSTPTGWKDSHIFETYVVSSVDQTVLFKSGGDDGHSIFVDDSFTTDLVTLNGVDYAAGAGFAVTAARYLAMDAGVSYKITLAGANNSGPGAFWFTIAGETEQGLPWGGPISNANNIAMSATGDFNVPEPTVLSLMALGLAGIGYRRRKQIKAA